MEEERVFMPGDAVVIEVDFRHPANIAEVEMIFNHESVDESVRSRMEFRQVGIATPGEAPPGTPDTTRHVARLQGLVTGEHSPGLYRCMSLVVVTAGGNRRAFPELPDGFFEVAPEPTNAPELLDFRYADPDFQVGGDW